MFVCGIDDIEKCAHIYSAVLKATLRANEGKKVGGENLW